MDNLQLVAQQRALTRRTFLRSAAVAGVGSRLLGFAPLRAAAAPRQQKTVVVTFGGGARDEETFAPEGQENIPHLLNELIPQSTFFTQVVNRGILGHYVATASLATGVYERFDNFADVAPENPTIFEYFRKGLGRPANDTWVIAPSNGFNRIGQSGGGHFAAGSCEDLVERGRTFGLRYAAVDAAVCAQPPLDHTARHGCRAYGCIFTVPRRHSPNRPSMR
jgi:hypothetical protein